MENNSIDEKPVKKTKKPWFFLLIITCFAALISSIGIKIKNDGDVKEGVGSEKTKLPAAPEADIYDVSQLEIEMSKSKAKREADAQAMEIELKKKIEEEREEEKMKADSIRKAKRDSIKLAKSRPKVTIQSESSDTTRE